VKTPLLYLVTDRLKLSKKTGDSRPLGLIPFLEQAAGAGVDMIQVRERDLTARERFDLVKSVAQAVGPRAHVLVNDRADIAAALPGVGVHLTTRSVPPTAVRAAFGKDILIGVSTHNLDEVRHAVEGGADFVVFGPVFDTESKREYGPPVGLNALRDAVAASRIPVLAIGGVKTSNFEDALGAGASGVAAISLFIDAEDLSELVGVIKGRT
jgi:thiamine-phosphate pyrophosphorylase